MFVGELAEGYAAAHLRVWGIAPSLCLFMGAPGTQLKPFLLHRHFLLPSINLL